MFVGTGSVKSKHETLLVLVPSKAELILQDSSVCKKLVEGSNYTLWELKGGLLIHSNSRKYRVQTNAETTQSHKLVPTQMWIDGVSIDSRGKIMCSSPITYGCLRNGYLIPENTCNVFPSGVKKEKIFNWQNIQGSVTLNWRDDDGFHLDQVLSLIHISEPTRPY